MSVATMSRAIREMTLGATGGDDEACKVVDSLR
jgi:hypothetical protein